MPRFFEVDREHLVATAVNTVALEHLPATLACHVLEVGVKAPWLR